MSHGSRRSPDRQTGDEDMTDQNISSNSTSPAAPATKPRRRGLIIGSLAALAIVAGGVGVAISQPGHSGHSGGGG